MEAAFLYHAKPNICRSVLPFVKTAIDPFSKPCQISFSATCSVKKFRLQTHDNHGSLRKCAALSAGMVVEEILSAEEEEEEEWQRVGMVGEICRERKGTVELLECLEREAIMGDDTGKHPKDYNRRAQILDKSDRVFQALKQIAQ